jgi:hypothetical protein
MPRRPGSRAQTYRVAGVRAALLDHADRFTRPGAVPRSSPWRDALHAGEPVRCTGLLAWSAMQRRGVELGAEWCDGQLAGEVFELRGADVPVLVDQADNADSTVPTRAVGDERQRI